MEENIQKFTERLRELVAQGKKKKSILEIQEINDFFADMELEAEQMEKVFEYLEANNIPKPAEWGDLVKEGEYAEPVYKRDGGFETREDGKILIRRSSAWQYVALSNEMKPTDFIAGRRTFAADFDRPSRIGERVDEFAKHGIPSSEWTKGSVEHGIPPIHPAEWLLDPNSARLAEGQEFDVFGNRVPAGTGWHFVSPGVLGRAVDGRPVAARWPRDFDPETGAYTDANKPGVSDEDVQKVVDGL